MEMILLESKRNSYYGNFKVLRGDAYFFFAPSPAKGRNIHFVENNANHLKCSTLPVYVQIPCELESDKDIELLNCHLSDISNLDSLNYPCIKNGHIEKKDLEYIEGGMRILNTLHHRLKGENFLEINVAGLSYDSIISLLKFIVRDVSLHCNVTYIVVAYFDEMFAEKIPIPITESSINFIINKLEQKNRQRFELRQK